MEICFLEWFIFDNISKKKEYIDKNLMIFFSRFLVEHNLLSEDFVQKINSIEQLIIQYLTKIQIYFVNSQKKF